MPSGSSKRNDDRPEMHSRLIKLGSSAHSAYTCFDPLFQAILLDLTIARTRNERLHEALGIPCYSLKSQYVRKLTLWLAPTGVNDSRTRPDSLSPKK